VDFKKIQLSHLANYHHGCHAFTAFFSIHNITATLTVLDFKSLLMLRIESIGPIIYTIIVAGFLLQSIPYSQVYFARNSKIIKTISL